MNTNETDGLVLEKQDDGISHSSGSRFSVTAMLARLVQQLEKRRSRMALLYMSNEQLKDIALSRADAYREAHRPFWDLRVPAKVVSRYK